jgi:hypothetical protein
MEDVVEKEQSFGTRHPSDFAIESSFVCNVHLDVLRPDDIETAIAEWHLQGARLSECDFVTQSHHACEGVGDIHIFLCEVDSVHLTLVFSG